MGIKSFFGRLRSKVFRILLGKDLHQQIINSAERAEASTAIQKDLSDKINFLDNKLDNFSANSMNFLYAILENKFEAETEIFYEIKQRKEQIVQVQESYLYKLKSIKASIEHGDSINVVFLCWERQKWNGDSLYKKFLPDRRFSPTVVIVLPRDTVYSDDPNYLFFKDCGYNVAIVSNGAELYDRNPDIVFYQQPWYALDGSFSPLDISQFALCVYFPYAVCPTYELPLTSRRQNFFQRLLYRQFETDPSIVKLLNSRGINNAITTGHPKLDAYLSGVTKNIWKDKDKYKVVYAPHHTFEKGTLEWVTFAWNGRHILQIAKDNPHTEWIFKPHPWFRGTVITAGIMSEQEINEYYHEWEKIGQIHDDGDYFDIFRTSDLLITDCGSFLAEYLPTGNPVIHLLSDNGERKYRSALNEQCSRHYYKVKNTEELGAMFNMLVNQKKDPLKEDRRKGAELLILGATDRIYNYFLKEFDMETGEI